MFKKALCWLLIIQHVNIYVLHATPGDIRVIFEEEAPLRPLQVRSSHPSPSSKGHSSFSRRLKLFRETDISGTEEEVLNVLFEVERTNARKFKISKVPSPKSRDICMEVTPTHESIRVFSKTKRDSFSLYLSPNGLAQIQQLDISKHLDVETFGDVHIRHSIKAARLSLAGKSIRNDWIVDVDDLTLEAVGTVDTVGKITNGASGQIMIGTKASVLRGHFENQGRIKGTDGSVLDLNGNDFTNRFLQQSLSQEFRSRISWQGHFSILNGGTFVNETDIAPNGAVLEGSHFSKGTKDSSLEIDTLSFINKSYIFATSHLLIRNWNDLRNEGKIEGNKSVSLAVGGNLTNSRSIKAEEALNITVGNILHNATTGSLEGQRVTLDVMRSIKNEGIINSRFLSLSTGKLENFGHIRIAESGRIQEKLEGAGLHNAKGAHISATQTLEILGQTFHNEGNQSGQGHIQAKALETHLNQLKNEGEIQATEKGTLHALDLTNTSSGTISFSKEGSLVVNKLINKGQVTGETLTGSIETLENSGSIISSLDLILDIKKLLTNVGEAIMYSLRHFGMRGEGTLQNEGKLLSEGDIKVNLQKVLNHAGMLANEGIEIEAQDFENTGRVVAPHLCFTLDKGVNSGPINKSIDSSSLENLRGLIAIESLQLTVHEAFENKGHIVGGKSLKLKGAGHFDNEGRVESTTELTAQIKKMTNKGVIHSQDLLTCEGLEEGLDNSGDMLSEREMKIVSSAGLINTGAISAEKVMHLTGTTLSNQGDISSKGNLTGEIGSFTNAKTLSSGDTLTLTLGALDNTGAIRSNNRLELFTRDESFNKGTIEAPALLHLRTEGEFLNTGDLTSFGVLDIEAQETFQNTGSMKGAIQVNYKGQKLFRQEGTLSSSGHVVVGAKQLYHTRLTEAGGNIDVNIEEKLHNEGVIRGKEGLRITAGRICNTHQFETPGLLFLISKGKTENHGKILAKKASLKAEAFVHHGVIKAIEGLTFNFRSLTTALKSRVSSKSDVSITGEEFCIEGIVKAEQHIGFEGRRLTNTGNISSQKAIHLKLEIFSNQGDISSKESLKGEIGSFKNAKTFSSEDILNLNLGTLENTGIIRSNNRLGIRTRDISFNKGAVEARSLLHLRTEGEFLNTGDLTSLGVLDIEAQETFQNTGSMKGTTQVDYKGQKLFKQEGILSSAGHVLVSAKQLYHTRLTEAGGNVDVGIEENLHNEGVIWGKQGLKITAGHIFNAHEFKTPELLFLTSKGKTENRGNILAKKASLAGESFVHHGSLKTHEELTVNFKSLTTASESLLSSKSRVSIAGDELLLEGRLDAGDLVDFKGRFFTNRGDIHSKTLIASVEENFINGGLFHGFNSINVEAQKIENAGTVSSEENLSLTSSQLENRGSLEAEEGKLSLRVGDRGLNTNVLKAKLLQIRGHTFENLSLNNVKVEEVDIEVQKLTNSGGLLSKTTTIVTDVLENLGMIGTSGDMTIEAHHFLKNERNSVVSARGALTLKGQGTLENEKECEITSEGVFISYLPEVENKGSLRAVQGISFDNLTKELKNFGQILSEAAVRLSSQSSVVNGSREAAIEARKGPLTITALDVMNLGTIGASSDMSLGVHKLLKNAKDAVISTKGDLTFKGDGKLENDEDGEITSEGTFFSSLPEVENKGALKAARGVTFENLTKELNNFGLILSETSVRIASKSQVLNGGRAGIIEARQGPLSIVSHNLINHRLINALDGALVLDVQQGENHNTLYGQHGIELTIGDLFTNYKLRNEGFLSDKKGTESLELGVLKSPGAILVKGEGSFTNQAYISSAKDVEVETNLDNYGQIQAVDHLHFVTPTKRFFNEGAGTVSVGQNIRIETTQPFLNRGTLRGAEAFIKTEGEFENEGSILVTDRALTLQLKNGHNRGTLQGQEKVDISVSGKVENAGKILSPQTLLLTGGGDLINGKEGFLRGDKTLSLQDLFLHNEGVFYSTHLIDLGHLRGPFTNGEKGRVVSLGNLTLHHLSTVSNLGYLQGDQATNIRIEELLNRGTILSKDGSLSISVRKGTNGSIGKLAARKSAEIEVDTLFLNEGEMTAEDRLSFVGRGRLINKGLLKGLTSFSSRLPSFENQGKVKSSSLIEIQEATEKLKNAKSGTIRSKGALIVRESSLFENEGSIEAATHLTLTLPELQNKGSIFSLGESRVTVERGSNAHDGILRAETDLTVDIKEKFTNEGEVSTGKNLSFQGLGVVNNSKLIHSGKDLVLETEELANEGELSSQQDIITTEALRKLINGTKATILSLGRLTLQNVRWVENFGIIQGQSGVEATGTYFSNSNAISSLSGSLQLGFKTLENKSLGRIQTQHALNLTLEDPFVNEGVLRSEKTFTFKGKSSLHNLKGISGTESLIIDVPSLVNEGEIGSDHTLTLQNIEKPFSNEEGGLITSQGRLTFANSPYFTNKGRVSTQTLGLPLQETVFKKFINQGTFGVSSGDFLVSMEEGVNSGVLKGSGILTLTLRGLGTSFDNKPSGKVSGDVLILQGTRPVHNQGYLHGESHLLYEAGELKNEGILSSLTLVEIKRDFENAPVFGVLESGKISSFGSITLAGTRKSQNTGIILGDKGITATFHTFANSGIFSTSEGSMDVSLQEGKNEGTLGAYGPLTLTVNKHFTNDGDLGSTEGELIFRGEGSFLNAKTLGAKRKLTFSIAEVLNRGTIIASAGASFVRLTKGLVNEPSGQILAKSSLLMSDVASFANEGNVEVEGEFLAFLGTFRNSKAVKATTLTFKASEGFNLSTGEIQGGNLALEIEDKFENEGVLLADHSLVTRGTGKFINRKQILSSGRIDLRNKTVVNQDHVQAEEIILGGDVAVDNHPKAKLLSKTQVESEEGVSLNNEGLVSTEGSLSFLHPYYQNNGRLEAQGNISFPNYLTFVNPKESVLVSTTGQILLPQVKSFVNEGILSTQGDFSLPSLTSFENRGKIQSRATLGLSSSENLVNRGDLEGSLGVTIRTPRNFSNKGKVTSSEGAVNIEASHLDNDPHTTLHGKEKVILTAKETLTNSGDITSPGTIELQATHVNNNHKVTGDQGVIVRGILTGHNTPVKHHSTVTFSDLVSSLRELLTHKTLQTFTNEKGATLESSQGLVKAQANTIRLSGVLRGKTVEIFSNSSPLIGKPEAIESLYVYAPHGWSLEKNPLEFPHDLTLDGHFLSPAPLNVKGNFTWFPGPSLSNSFNLIVGGIFTLSTPGSWTNSAKVQAARGAEISLDHFINEGAFYSGGDTRFNCEGNFENCSGRLLLMRGSTLLDVKGSVINHPRATFRQEGADKVVTFEVGDTIGNLAGSVFIEGQLNASSKVFVNEVESPTLVKRTNEYKFWKANESGPLIDDQQLQNHVQWYESVFGEMSRGPNRVGAYILVLHLLEEAVREIAPTNPALFYAGGAVIKAGLFQNLGGTFATRTHFTFNGPTFKHFTADYVDRGKHVKKIGLLEGGFYSSTHEVAYSGWCRGEYVNCIKVPFETVVDRKIGTLSSLGPISIHASSREETGDIKASTLSLSMPSLTFGLEPVHQKTTKILPLTMLDRYFDEQTLLSSSFWILDKEKKTVFQWIPEIPYKVISAKALNVELSEKGHAQATFEQSQLASYKTWVIKQLRQEWSREDTEKSKSRPQTRFGFFCQSQTEDKKRQEERAHELSSVLSSLVIPEFWEVSSHDLPFMKSAITPASLYESPPLMAVVRHPLMKGNERVRWHPVLAAELLTKSLMDNIGMASLSRTIQTPELLLRVLEMKAYLEAKRLHGKPALLPPPHWEDLSSEEQLSRRQIEPITWDETSQFQDPGVIFELKQVYGENVLSAVLTLPKELRRAFESLVGKKVVRYLNLVSTEGDIDFKSPTFAIEGVSLQSARNTTTQDVFSQGDIVSLSKGNYTNLGRTLSQQGQLAVIAEQTCTNYGIMTGNDVSLMGRDVIVETRKKRETTPYGHKESLERTAVVTSTDKDVSLTGEHAVGVIGSFVKANNDISIEAPVLFLGAQTYSTRSQTDTGLYETQHHKKSVFETGHDFKPHARDLLHIEGVDVASCGKIQLKSDGILEEKTVSDKEHSVQTTKEDDGWFGSYEETSVSSKSTPLRNRFISKGGIEVEGSKSLSISAPQITTKKGIAFKSLGKIKTGHTESSSRFSQQTSDLGFIWQSRTNEGHEHTTILLPHMTAPEGVVFSTPQGVDVTIKSPSMSGLFVQRDLLKGGGWQHHKRDIGLEHALTVLENTPETAWIKSLRHNPAVNWHLVSDVHKEWNETTQGLAPGAGALISLAVVIATQGLGAQYIAPLMKGWTLGVETLGTMANAGFSTLLSQTATSLIGNQFDLGKTFQQLMSKESLLALGTSIGTAGLTFGLSDQLGVSLNGTDFFDRLQRSVVQTGSSTALRILTDDLDVGEALQQGFVNVVAMSVGGWAANKIGQMYNPAPILLQDGTIVVPEPSIGWLEHKGLHFGLGFLEGMASDLKHPLRGAWGGGFGAAFGEILMEGMVPSREALQLKASRGTLAQSDLLDFKAHLERRSDIARLGTAFASFMLGQDVNASILTATNAIENNFNATALTHLAQTLSQEEFTEVALDEWEREYGPLSLKEKKIFRQKCARIQNTLRVMDFSREMFSPGQRLFEETASLPYEEFRIIKLSEMNPKKLLTSKGWENAERIIQNHYGFYQQKQVDLTLAPLFGLVGGGLGVARVIAKPKSLMIEGPQANRNVVQVPLVLEAPKMADHHIFPQQFRKFFEQKGIDIDKFTVSVGEITHLKGLHGKGNGRLPGKWNQRWRSFIEENPNATTRELYQFGGKLMSEYQLDGLKIHGYKETLK